MKLVEEKSRKRSRRKAKIRKKISGSLLKPRVTVFKSNRYIYVQAVDDAAGNTLAAVSNNEKDKRDNVKKNVANAALLGELLAKKLGEKKISTVVFDRNGYPYKGIVKAVAEGIRKAGIIV
jgi:large subunit ribosomal protein L18